MKQLDRSLAQQLVSLTRAKGDLRPFLKSFIKNPNRYFDCFSLHYLSPDGCINAHGLIYSRTIGDFKTIGIYVKPEIRKNGLGRAYFASMY